MDRMTTLDKQLAQTFRAARWGATGQPACPSCFDGADLATPTADPLTPGLSRYRCTVCNQDFSDVKDTVFATRKPVPLALWAYVVLLGDPRRIDGFTDREVARCSDLTARAKHAPLWGLWRAELEQAGITVERLRRALARHPEAA
jgi:hypothetical protein